MTRAATALRPTRRTAPSARFRLGHAGRNPAGRADRRAVGARRHLSEEQLMTSDEPAPTSEAAPMPFAHQPVMEGEVVEFFGPVPAGIIVDATVGGGGHAHALLSTWPHLRLVGLDQDPAAVEAARERLEVFGDRATVVQARFDHLSPVVTSLGITKLSGVLFDLGVSSHQFDQPERGFSYRFEGPLDMRMDPTSTTTAKVLVDNLSEDALADVLRNFGDEKYASRISKAIIEARPIRTTSELADVVRSAIPAPARRRGGHPAKRTFQALRLVVNDELGVLPTALDAALSLLAPGGRCVVLSYHSGEDRIVKAGFRRAATGGCTCPDRLPCVCGAVPSVRLLKQGSIKPSAAEVRANPRAESARLRVVERIAGELAPNSGASR